MMTRGADADRAVMEAQGLLYREMQRQATMLAFADSFWFIGVICLAVVPLIFMMRMPKGPRVRGGAH